MTDTELPPSAVDRLDPPARLEQARLAAETLARVDGEMQLQAAVLALLLPPGSQRARRAWKLESKGTPGALELLAHVDALAPRDRLPWFETLVSRMRGQAPAARQGLLEATRRLMGARGVMRPIDKLHWLAMRQRLAGGARAAAGAAAATDLSRLPQGDVLAIGTYTAFLSRMVPVDEATAAAAAAMPEKAAAVAANSSTDDATGTATPAPAPAPAPAPTPAPTPTPTPGAAWYGSVMSIWHVHAAVEPCRPPDTDALVHALQELQAMAWMHRPMLVRAWFTAAQQHSPHGRLTDLAADALRLSCALLDSPLPPELARHHGASPPENAR